MKKRFRFNISMDADVEVEAENAEEARMIVINNMEAGKYDSDLEPDASAYVDDGIEVSQKMKQELDYHKALLDNGWECIEGYAMDYATPEESQHCIISKEEILKCIFNKPKMFYFPKGDYEWARDEDEAWECLLDDLMIKFDTQEEGFVVMKLLEQQKVKANTKGDN